MKSLTEQLEQEKKAANDVKSLKTQQISTLTSKLANAVRQRERAEEELAKVNKEMEELKEKLRLQAEEKEAKESEDDTDGHRKEDENSTHQCAEETEAREVNIQDDFKAKDNNIALSCLENDDTNPVDELIENGIGSLQLENKCDPLWTEKGLDENSPKEELSQSATHTEVSLSLSSGLSDDFFKENSSVQDKHEDLFHLEVSQNSSSEMYDSYHINHSFESHEENPEEKVNIQGFKQIEEDLCEVQESMNHDLGDDVKNITEERQKILEAANQSAARKNRRVCAENSEEDQESSPPSSPEAVSSGYTSNSTDEKLVNLLMYHEMGGEHSAGKFPGNEGKEQEVHRKGFFLPRPGDGKERTPGTRLGFFNEYESDDVTRETTKVQGKKALEDFIKREEAARSALNKNDKALEERCLSSKTASTANEAEKVVRKSSAQQNDFLSQTMSEEFWDLKQQLKNALKEIEELRLENKEMKREIRNLSSSAAEEEFLLKTTKFTDRLLKEMKKREARMYVPRGLSALEKYGLERDYSNPGSTDLSQMRSTGDTNRSVGRKTSLPLKIIGAKLKELTRSVENMATDPELCEETFSEACVPDFLGYKQRYPSLNDQFELEESLIIPAPFSETIAQSVPFKQEKPREIQKSGGYTSVEKLGEKSFLASSKIQPKFAEEACEQNRFQLTDRQTQEQSDFDSPRGKWRRHSDTRDYVQRYVVRSSDHIAKMRDLTPEEKAFYSKLA